VPLALALFKRVVVYSALTPHILVLALLALAQLRAFHIQRVAFAVFLQTIRFLAVAPLEMPSLVSATFRLGALSLRPERVRVPVHNLLDCLFALLRMCVVVRASLAIAILAAILPYRETIAVKFQALRSLAIAHHSFRSNDSYSHCRSLHYNSFSLPLPCR
jgi:hypothetical protein